MTLGRHGRRPKNGMGWAYSTLGLCELPHPTPVTVAKNGMCWRLLLEWCERKILLTDWCWRLLLE